MLIYTSNKAEFIDDVRSNTIDEKIHESVQRYLGTHVGQQEVKSWRNSMMYMSHVLADEAIPVDAGVAIEYTIPQSNKRIDFILTGKGDNKEDTAIIVELKQWENVKTTKLDGVVVTYIGHAEREMTHPSYQAWTYAALLSDFNETVQTEKIRLQPCAYLHNCVSSNEINDPFYDAHTRRAPAFLKKDSQKLADFIKKYVKYGDSDGIMYRIDKGRIRPSKNLADKLVSLLQGNQEFLMIDDQKVVYETALALAEKSSKKNKNVLIVEGGPGTGKSVVAVNLLVTLTNKRFLAQYVTKNAAPRAVYISKLTGSFTKSHIDNLFKGSGSYTDTEANGFDALIVDEAHRLNEKSGMFQNMGENQIKELIQAAKFSVFFIDEDQRVTLKDIGEKETIKEWAKLLGANVHELELQSQFRCNGSDGYLAWIDNALQIRDTANETLQGINYDFRVFDTPNELRSAVLSKNKINNKARLVAGYCWNWISKNDESKKDIAIQEHNFAMRWNLASDGSLWILKPDSVNEVGCIHTCQGLETDYIGVIIGPDFIIRNGVAITNPEKRAKTDASIKGYKVLFKKNAELAKQKADAIIKNTYRTLMTRAMKGCYLFCTDEETNAWFKQLMGREPQEYVDAGLSSQQPSGKEQLNHRDKYQGLTLRLLKPGEVKPYENSVPIYDFKIAAGLFSEMQLVGELPSGKDTTDIETYQWVELPDSFKIQYGHFVARVIGESMNRRIPNGSWCLFKLNPAGTRQGKIVLVQHRDIQDPDTGAQYTVKVYESEKVANDDGTWQHSRIVLRPDTNTTGYKEMTFSDDSAGELRVIAELVAVLG
ncbi:MAG: DNA/RNA helicase domain-containing protein [Sulfuricaulis sp.]